MATDQIFEGVKNAAHSVATFSVNAATMGAILFALIGLYLLSTLFSYISQRILASVSQKFSLNLQKTISEKLNRIPLKYYDTHKKGEILSCVTSDLERVYKLQDELEEIPDTTTNRLLPNPKDNVSFEHIRFGYSDDKILMEDINFNVKAGSKVAIAGPAVAGKTTLISARL